MFPQSISLHFSHHRIVSVYRVQRGVLSFHSLLPSFTCSHSPVEITLIVIPSFFLSFSYSYSSLLFKQFVLFCLSGPLSVLQQFAIMIVPNLSTVLLASMGIVSVANAYSPNFVHIRAALERRQVRAQFMGNFHRNITNRKLEQ